MCYRDCHQPQGHCLHNISFITPSKTLEKGAGEPHQHRTKLCNEVRECEPKERGLKSRTQGAKAQSSPTLKGCANWLWRKEREGISTLSLSPSAWVRSWPSWAKRSCNGQRPSHLAAKVPEAKADPGLGMGRLGDRGKPGMLERHRGGKGSRKPRNVACGDASCFERREKCGKLSSESTRVALGWHGPATPRVRSVSLVGLG